MDLYDNIWIGVISSDTTKQGLTDYERQMNKDVRIDFTSRIPESMTIQKRC